MQNKYKTLQNKCTQRYIRTAQMN